MKIPDLQKRMTAAFNLIAGPTTTIEKFEHARTLLEGVHPDLDAALKTCSEALDKIGKLERGELLQLSAEHMPETTEEQKKRKKALLLFIESLKNLRSEITRVRAELAGFEHSSSLHQTKSVGRILTKAKGPLGLVTLAAVVIVVGATVLKKQSLLNMLGGANSAPTPTPSTITSPFTGQGTTSKAFSYWVKEAGIDFPTGMSGQVIWKIHVHKENVDTFRTGEHVPATGAVVTAELRSASGTQTLTGTIGPDGWVYWYEPTPTSATSLYVINVKGDLPWASADQQMTKNQPLASYKPS